MNLSESLVNSTTVLVSDEDQLDGKDIDDLKLVNLRLRQMYRCASRAPDAEQRGSEKLSAMSLLHV